SALPCNDEPEAGIREVVEWHAGHADEPAWSRAAGVYVRMLSTPQLFVEGDHRTGVLVMSHILMSAGRPPFVLSVANARAYFEASTALRARSRCSACRASGGVWPPWCRTPTTRDIYWSDLLRRRGGLGCGAG